MAAIPLKILIHGLIALIPTIDPDGVHRLTALLIDGRNPCPSALNLMLARYPLLVEGRNPCLASLEGMHNRHPLRHSLLGNEHTPIPSIDCTLDHHPKLQFFVEETAECIAVPGCQAKGNRCICAYDENQDPPDPLVGKHIYLEILPAPVLASTKPDSSLPEHSLPSDSREAGKFAYVANLSQAPFHLTVDPAFLARDPAPKVLDRLVARMEIPYKDLTACNLATRLDGGERNVHSMSFRPLFEPPDSGEVSYALAQRVVAELSIPAAGEGGQIVRLHISDFGGESDHPITLLPSQEDGAYRIELSNAAQDLEIDHPCDDGVARHFTHYYALAKKLPEEEEPKLPHVRPTQFRSEVPLKPNTCKDRIFAIESRPICPMASFNP